LISYVARTVFLVLLLQVARSPLMMAAVGTGFGMWIEHARPGTAAVAIGFAQTHLGGAASAVNPLNLVYGATQQRPMSSWDGGQIQ